MLNLLLEEKKYIIIKIKYNELDDSIFKQKNIFNITFEKNCISIIIEENANDFKQKDMSNTKWIAFKIDGQLDFQLSGVLNSFTTPLSESNISILVISSFDTDYIFIESKKLSNALSIFKKYNIKVIKEAI